MKREKITVVNFYSVFPFNHGGSQEIRGFCKGLSEYFDVNLVVFSTSDHYKEEVAISKYFKVITVAYPKPLLEDLEKHYQNDFKSKSFNDVSVFAFRHYDRVPGFEEKLRKIAIDSRIVVTVHPYTYRLLKKSCPDKLIWYRAQNVEYNYKKATWNKVENSERLLREVHQCEVECCKGSDLILTITQDDADCFHKEYDINTDKILNIRAGCNMENLDFTPPSMRKINDDRYRLTAFFISYSTSAAIEAANKIIKIASETPDVKYIIAGRVGDKIDRSSIPDNVYIGGMVSEAEKINFLKTSDVALNLIESGSGLNMKMLEYFAYGIPVITTKYGARGLDVESGKDCVITDEANYKNDILAFCEMSVSERENIANSAFDLLKRNYDWRSIAKKIVCYIEEKYPNIYGGITSVPEKDIELFPAEDIKSYVFDKDKPLFIWGAGEWGRGCLNLLHKTSITPMGIVDSDCEKWGKTINNIEIFSPDYLFNKENANIIIAVGQFLSILSLLLRKNIKLSNIFLLVEGNKIVPLQKDALPYYFSYEKIVQVTEYTAERE